MNPALRVLVPRAASVLPWTRGVTLADDRVKAVSDLCDKFGQHFEGHDWATVIAALSLSLRAALECASKPLYIRDQDRALDDELARLTQDALTHPVHES